MDYKLFDERFVLFYIGSLVIAMPVIKYLMRLFVLFLRKNGFNIRNVVIIGSDKAAIRFYHLVNNNPNFGYQIIGFLADEPVELKNVKVIGKTNELDKVVETYKVQEVIVAIPKIDFSDIEKIIRIVNNAGVRVRVIPDFYHLFYNRYVVKNFGDIPMISLRKEPLEEPHWRFVKRAFDIIFSLFVLIFICSWLFFILAIIIKLDSKGPVFFKQKRMGKNKKDFDCFKFRSMTVNSNSDLLQASKNDSRITRVGRFIRKTSLDEFPQFFNVLKGEMSIVGPRPHMTKHNEEYSKIIEHYMVRQLVKPGITGWAQVNGFRGETKEDIDMLNRVEYDVWYLENWYFMLDVKIVFMTVWNVFKGEEKAY
jgi:Undecaprenyl-phosphate glucose phosphotransferase